LKNNAQGCTKRVVPVGFPSYLQGFYLNKIDVKLHNDQNT